MSRKTILRVLGTAILGTAILALGMFCPLACTAKTVQGPHWASVPDVQNGDAPFWWAQILYTKSQGVPWTESDFASLAHSGMTGIEINPIWAKIEPKQGHYDFSLLDRYMAQAAKTHLKVYLIFWLSENPGNNPPPWIPQHDISSDGIPAKVAPWWDGRAQKAYLDYIARTIDHVKSSPSFGGLYTSYGWLDSEWGMPPKGSHGVVGYAPDDIREFYRWLPREYKTIGGFNHRWHTAFKRWIDVPAAKPGDALFPLYQQFRLYSVADSFDAMSRVVRAHTDATLIYAWGGEICGIMGPSVQGNDPDTFFQKAKQYHAVVNLDDANVPGLALIFGSMARAYRVPLLEEWTPGHNRMSRTPKWLSHIGLAAPFAVGEDFYIYPPPNHDAGFEHGWNLYTDWHATLAKVIHGYTPEQPVAVIVPTRKIALSASLNPYPALTSDLTDFWRHNRVLPHFITDEEITTGVVNLQQFHAVVDLGDEVDTLPSLKRYAANHPVLKSLDQALPYLRSYASVDPEQDSLEIVPTVDGSSVWLTIANTDAAHLYSGTIRFDPAAVGLGSLTYGVKNARTGKTISATRNADGSLQWHILVPAAQLLILHVNLSGPIAKAAGPDQRSIP